jgi:serine protease Do
VEQASSGSGFILTQDGYILTNYHVVEDATTIQVTTYAGDTYDATYIGGDDDYDIAVIKIDVTGLSPVTIGDSDQVSEGDSVIAIGNPLGELTFSLSSGSVSSANRAITVDDTPFTMIQVDLPINPGNSGGPLLNTYGEVIGIVSAKYSSYSDTTVEGLGFAIPINDVYAMVQDIMENGFVTDKAYLGITGASVTSTLQKQFNLPTSEGVFVYSIDKDGAAAKSGLQAGDIIISMGGKDITSMTDLTTAKKGYRAGDTVEMIVNRSGDEVTLQFTFGAQPQETASDDDEDDTDTSTGATSQNPYSYYYGYGNGGYGNNYYGSYYN